MVIYINIFVQELRIRKFVLQVVGMHEDSPWGVEVQLLVPRSIAAAPGGSLGRAVSQSYQTN